MAEQVAIIAPVAEQDVGLGERADLQSGTPVFAHLPFAQQQDQRSALAIAHGVELRVQAALGPPDTPGNILFLKGSRSSGGLQVGGIDHQLIRPPALGRQRRKNEVEHARPAPADEAIVDRLVRAIVLRCVAPAQPVADHKDGPADHPSIVDPRHTVRQRKVRFNPALLRLQQPDPITHGSTSLRRH